MKATEAQADLLEHLAAGRSLERTYGDGFKVRFTDEKGVGWVSRADTHTVRALERRQWIDERMQITEAGRKALEAADAR